MRQRLIDQCAYTGNVGRVRGSSSPSTTSSSTMFLLHGSSAVVPHLGVHLQDLTFIEDGNTAYLSDCPHLVNIGKLDMIHSSIARIRALQTLKYNIEPIRYIQAVVNKTIRPFVFASAQESDEASKELFALSMHAEPPQSARPKPAPQPVPVQDPPPPAQTASSMAQQGSMSRGFSFRR